MKMKAGTIPNLSPDLQEELKHLSALEDTTIDFSDIPATTDNDWREAARGRFYRPLKQQLTLRIDADVLEWFRAQGQGYQSRMNAVLRREMLNALAHR